MNYNVTVNGKVYSVTVEKTGAAAPVAAAPVAAPVAAAPAPAPRSCCRPGSRPLRLLPPPLLRLLPLLPPLRLCGRR